MGSLEASLISALNGSTRADAAGQKPSKEYLTFKLGAEEYGIDILKVQEIRGYEAPTRLVNSPPFVKGVVNLRGVIVPIIDLRMRLDLSEPKYDAFTVVIVLNLATRVAGVVVDGVSDVLELAAEHVKQAPKFDATVDADFVTGIGSIKQGDQERMLILMDIEQLMAVSDMAPVEAPNH